MAVDALTPAELASLGIGSVPGTGPAFGVGMTPNELKEALDRRGIGYDRALLGSMQQEYASMFGSGAKTAKKDKTDEEEDVIYGGTPPNVTPPGAPPAKDYWGYSAPTTTTKTVTDELVNQFNGVSLFDKMGQMGMVPKSAPPSLPGLPAPSVVPGLPGFTGGGQSEADRIEQENNSGAGAPGSQHSSPNEIGGLMNTDKDYAPPNAGPSWGGWDYDYALGSTNTSSGATKTSFQDKGNEGRAGATFGGGEQGGVGNGSGSNGVGNGNDAGSGTAGAGQSGEGGQWREGTAMTGDDGDMMMDEEVDGQVHENEAVIPRPMRNDIGEDVLAEAIGLYQDQGLTPRERKVMLKDLLGEWAASK